MYAMAKSLKVLAAKLREQGLRLVPTFDLGIVPGSILEVRRWNDINRVGHITDDPAIQPGDLDIEGPTPCALLDTVRGSGLEVKAALEMLQPSAAAKAEFLSAKEALVNFDSPVSYTVSRIRLEDTIERAPGFWDRNTGQHLRPKKRYLTIQVIRGRVAFLFRGSGSGGVDLRSTALKNLKEAGLSGRWRWRNASTLETKDEVVIAVDLARYNFRKKMLVSERMRG